jgi:hypothetical protein
LDEHFSIWRKGLLETAETQALTADFLKAEAAGHLAREGDDLVVRGAVDMHLVLREEAVFQAADLLGKMVVEAERGGAANHETGDGALRGGTRENAPRSGGSVEAGGAVSLAHSAVRFGAQGGLAPLMVQKKRKRTIRRSALRAFLQNEGSPRFEASGGIVLTRRGGDIVVSRHG